MKSVGYREMVEAKRHLQDAKEQSIREMSPSDWELAKANFERAASEGKLPPKMKSHRNYKDSGLGF